MSPCRKEAEGASSAQAAAEESQDRQTGADKPALGVADVSPRMLCTALSAQVSARAMAACPKQAAADPGQSDDSGPQSTDPAQTPCTGAGASRELDAGSAPCHGSLNNLVFHHDAGRRFHRRGPCDDAGSTQTRSPQTSRGQACDVRRVRRRRHPAGGASGGQGMMSCGNQHSGGAVQTWPLSHRGGVSRLP